MGAAEPSNCADGWRWRMSQLFPRRPRCQPPAKHSGATTQLHRGCVSGNDWAQLRTLLASGRANFPGKTWCWSSSGAPFCRARRSGSATAERSRFSNSAGETPSMTCSANPAILRQQMKKLARVVLALFLEIAPTISRRKICQNDGLKQAPLLRMRRLGSFCHHWVSVFSEKSCLARLNQLRQVSLLRMGRFESLCHH